MLGYFCTDTCTSCDARDVGRTYHGEFVCIVCADAWGWNSGQWDIEDLREDVQRLEAQGIDKIDLDLL